MYIEHVMNGMIKNALFCAMRSLAVKPQSANMCCPGLRRSTNPLFSTTNLSLELPEKPVDTKLKSPVNRSIDAKNLTDFCVLRLLGL